MLLYKQRHKLRFEFDEHEDADGDEGRARSNRLWTTKAVKREAHERFKAWKLRKFKDARPESLSFLYIPYRNELYYWEVLECFKRLMLSGGLVIFGDESNSRAVFAVCLCLLFWAIYTHCRPFNNDTDNFLNEASQAMLLIVFFMCLLQNMTGISVIMLKVLMTTAMVLPALFFVVSIRMIFHDEMEEFDQEPGNNEYEDRLLAEEHNIYDTMARSGINENWEIKSPAQVRNEFIALQLRRAEAEISRYWADTSSDEDEERPSVRPSLIPGQPHTIQNTIKTSPACDHERGNRRSNDARSGVEEQKNCTSEVELVGIVSGEEMVMQRNPMMTMLAVDTENEDPNGAQDDGDGEHDNGDHMDSSSSGSDDDNNSGNGADGNDDHANDHNDDHNDGDGGGGDDDEGNDDDCHGDTGQSAAPAESAAAAAAAAVFEAVEVMNASAATKNRSPRELSSKMKGLMNSFGRQPSVVQAGGLATGIEAAAEALAAIDDEKELRMTTSTATETDGSDMATEIEIGSVKAADRAGRRALQRPGKRSPRSPTSKHPTRGGETTQSLPFTHSDGH